MTRVFLDSNVLLSAALWPDGATAACYRSAVTSGHDVVVSDYVLDEVRTVMERKFPHRTAVVDEFLAAVLAFAECVTTPDKPEPDEDMIRDDRDRPVLRGARAAACDLLITGDKDILEAGVDSPEVIRPADYAARFAGEPPPV